MGKPNTIARGFPRLLVERKTATAVISNYSLELQHHTYSVHHHHHNHHQSLNREGCWGTTDDFATSLLHFPLFSTALWDLPNSRPVHSLMLSSHLFLCLPCFLPPLKFNFVKIFTLFELHACTVQCMCPYFWKCLPANTFHAWLTTYNQFKQNDQTKRRAVCKTK